MTLGNITVVSHTGAEMLYFPSTNVTLCFNTSVVYKSEYIFKSKI